MSEGTPDVPSGSGGDFFGMKVDVEREENIKEQPDIVASSESAASQTKVEYMRHGAKIQLPNLWEFVPYNEALAEMVSERFSAAVEVAKLQLLGADSLKSKEELLGVLKGIYDKEFGGGSYERNVISLSLYSGPIYLSWRRVRLLYFHPKNFSRSVVRARIWDVAPTGGDIKRCSILYTGDGYLDTAARLDSLVNYFLDARIEQVGVFQVMHHGSKKNWHAGVAAKISSLFSVFSSDPEHKKFGHPDKEVLRDFWRYGAVQVDKHRGFSVSGLLKR
jgi:hypothetical protein